MNTENPITTFSQSQITHNCKNNRHSHWQKNKNITPFGKGEK